MASLVVEDRHADDALAGGGCGHVGRHVGRFQLGRQLSLPLVSPVLEPDFDLGLGETEGSGQSGPLRTGQVALHVEGGFQLENLWPISMQWVSFQRCHVIAPFFVLFWIQMSVLSVVHLIALSLMIYFCCDYIVRVVLDWNWKHPVLPC